MTGYLYLKAATGFFPVQDTGLTGALDIIRRLQPQLAQVEGITLFLEPIQDLTVEDRVSRTQYQYSLEDARVPAPCFDTRVYFTNQWGVRWFKAFECSQDSGGPCRPLRGLG
jgi:hypothetical protein